MTGTALPTQTVKLDAEKPTIEHRLKSSGGIVIPSELKTVREVINFATKQASVTLEVPIQLKEFSYERPLHNDIPISPISWIELALRTTPYTLVVSDDVALILMKSDVERTTYEKKYKLVEFRHETLSRLGREVEFVFVPHFWKDGLCSIKVDPEKSVAVVNATRNVHEQLDRFFRIKWLHETEVAKLNERIRKLEAERK